MKLAQRKIKWLARLMLVLMLFAQGIVAANACIETAASPVQAYSMAQQEDEAMPCHDDLNANACLASCTQSDQVNVDQHTVPLAAPVSAIAWVSNQPPAQHLRPVIFPEHLVLDTGPPIPIRFCSFLN
jgi:hypothetical protein